MDEIRGIKIPEFVSEWDEVNDVYFIYDRTLYYTVGKDKALLATVFSKLKITNYTGLCKEDTKFIIGLMAAAIYKNPRAFEPGKHPSVIDF